MKRSASPSRAGGGTKTDVLGRKVWDKDHYAAKAAERAAGIEAEFLEGGAENKKRKLIAPAERTFLHEREDDLKLEKDIGKQKILAAAEANKAGFACTVCDCLLKDSAAFLDHVNGKKHNRLLGMTMRVKKSSKEEVASRLQMLKDKLKKKNEAAPK